MKKNQKLLNLLETIHTTSKMVTWWPTGYDIGRVDLKRSWSIDLQFRDFPKSENFACPDLSNLQNRKTTNISENLDMPSESSEQHLDKVLTFIELIGAGYLTCSIIVQKLQDLSSLTKNQKISNPLETIHTTS